MKRIILVAILLLLVPHSAYSATTWYMPEGSTQGFDLYILVTNPNSSDVNITYTFYTGAAATVTQTGTVSANSRSTLHVNSISGLSNGEISTKVECTNGLNIYAERAMYWPNDGSSWVGGHSSRAVSGLEGCYTEISQPSSFPIIISNSGSYKLVSNITVPSTVSTNGIEITVDNVTLDLNGFTITGPSYSLPYTSSGIELQSVGSLTNIKIMNGTIGNFPKAGILSLDSTQTMSTFTISDIIFWRNGKWGVAFSPNCPGVIKNCLFKANGIGTSDDESGGLYVTSGTLVIGNVFSGNGGYGIYAVGNSVFGYGNFIKDNIVELTLSGGPSITESGIYVSGNNNRVEGNHCCGNNTSDINLAGSGNLCINNSVTAAVVNAGDDTVTVSNQANTVL